MFFQRTLLFSFQVKKIYLYVILLYCLQSTIHAQLFPVYYHSQHTLNPVTINPSLAGIDNSTRITLSSRQNLKPIPQSPKTQLATFETSIGNNGKKLPKTYSGLGSFLVYDSDGPFKQLGFQIQYAYHISLNKLNTNKLSLGLSFNGLYHYIHSNSTVLESDPLLGEKLNTFLPNANSGIFLNLQNGFYTGISATDLFGGQSSYFANKFSDSEVMRRYFFRAGIHYKVTDNLRITPEILVNTHDGAFSDCFKELTYSVYTDIADFSLGLSFYAKHDFLLSGIYHFNRFKLGFAYEFPMSKTRTYTYGTVEVFMAFRL